MENCSSELKLSQKSSTLPDLYFLNPVFRAGLNVTVRKGNKWLKLWLDNDEKPFQVKVSPTPPGKGPIFDTSVKEIQYMRCCDIPCHILDMEHDSECRTRMGLYKAMKRAYPDFQSKDYATIIFFGGIA